MGTTVFTGPVKSGDLLQGQVGGPNQGLCSLYQSTTITQNGTNPVSSTMNIPAGSILTSFNVDVLTAFNSTTSAILSVGVSAGATTYVSGVSCLSTGRIAPTYTAAQLAAMSDQSVLGVVALTTAPVVVTVTPTGTTSAGFVNVGMHYVQTTSSN